ncbi:GDSL-type esterase/lipase family protein [Streptomyces sp. NBC_01431]|uniref:GDSL-type esterase/lipase family protein n=1 Tax=Streptomyces sp. NBC_01431 TaxID=2903863 RepID=UPI002E367F65|nr:GDSL-type esterase/lipase family protein [Streptomyces sp. NBC_01431]
MEPDVRGGTWAAEQGTETGPEGRGTDGSRWLDPAPFLRGVAWLDAEGRAVRADPEDAMRLPWDTGERAALPIGMRIEFTAHGASAVEIRYRARVPEPAEALHELAHTFALWQGDRCLGESAPAPLEEGYVRLQLPPCDGPFTIHPPEAQGPLILAVRGVGGAMAPAPRGPRWVVHGDSITEGWWSTRPAHAWPAVAGRALGLDTVNLGYAGGARGELPTAEQLARLPADAITLAFGTNCWSRTPFSATLLYETTLAFVRLIRLGHPDVPVLLLSPVLRPEAEASANQLGATLAELRTAMEEAGRDLIGCGDDRLHVLPGRDLLGPDDLADGLHPNDSGHARIAAAVTAALREIL